MFELNDNEKRILEKFIRENKSKYSKGIQEFFDEVFDIDEIYQNDFMGQIYAYLFTKKYASNLGVYIFFIELLQAKFPNLSKRTILEVASGYIPGLAILINELYKPDKQITCMDPKSLDLSVDNIIVLKKKFTTRTKISKYDLLLAHCPCDVFDDMVKKVIKTPTDMCVQTCPCRYDGFFSRQGFEYYIDSQVDKLRSLEDMGYSVEVDKTDAYAYTMAPVVTVLKREFPKIKYPRK